MEKVAKLCCVIIVTYNGDKWIKKCLGSIKSGSISPKIFVVDNGSKDSTLSIVNEFSGVELIENDQNIGFGKANNLALKKAYDEGFDYFFLLNQDTHVEEDVLEELVKSSQKNPEYGIISPVHKNGGGTDLDISFKRYVRRKFNTSFLDDYFRESLQSKLYQVPFVNAAAWMISRRCLQDVGLFHPLFFHYGEDNNYGSRVLQEGYRIGILGSVTIFHYQDQKTSNSFKDNPRIKIEWKTKINVLHALNHGQKTRRFFGVFFDIVSMSFKCSFKDFFPFWFFALKNWWSFRLKAKSFDNNLLKIN